MIVVWFFEWGRFLRSSLVSLAKRENDKTKYRSRAGADPEFWLTDVIVSTILQQGFQKFSKLEPRKCDFQLSKRSFH